MNRETGFLDKNKNMIHEGDTLVRECHWDSKVVWNDKQQEFMLEIIHDDPDMRFQFELKYEHRSWTIKKQGM